MATNLINALLLAFSDTSFQNISEYVGINSESTKNGVKAIIPAVLASILGNNTVNSSNQPVWWNALDDEYPYSEDEFVLTNNIHNSTFLVKGREVVSGMFRTNHDDLINSVSSVAGIQKEKSAGLIEVAVPLIVGHLKNLIQRKGWNFKDLIENLIASKSYITEALPNDISPDHFGVGNLPKDNFSKTIDATIPITKAPKKRKNNLLIWFGGLVLIALIAILLWHLMNNSGSKRIKVDTEEMLVPGIRDTIVSNQSFEKIIDLTYYADEVNFDLGIKN